MRHRKNKLHIIKLTDKEYRKLIMLVKSGIEHARVITRARVLLLAHEGQIDKEIAGIFSLSRKNPMKSGNGTIPADLNERFMIVPGRDSQEGLMGLRRQKL